MKFLLLFLPVVLGATSNSVTITDLSGSTQTDRAITISRVFKQGEIANYPKPRVGGTPATTWQTDNKTYWSDGSVAHSVISLVATITASGSITVDFVNDTNPCSSGNQSACNAASLDQTGMAGFLSGAWDAQVEATAGSVTHTVSAKTILSAGYWSYWLRGPVVTAVQVQDMTAALSYDFGWDCTANCTGDHSTATWIDASSNTTKSIHPQFYLKFYTGASGVETSFVLEDVWDVRAQDIRYTMTFKTGSPLATAYGPYTVTQSAGTRWHKGELWSGTALGKIKTDFNLAYMTESKAIPNFDTSLAVTSTNINSLVSYWTGTTDQGAPFGNWMRSAGPPPVYLCGGVLKYQPNTGARADIGILPSWVVQYLYTMDRKANDLDLYTIMIKNAEVGGYIPMHKRHSVGTYAYCALSALCVSGGLDTVTTMGKTPSRDAYGSGSYWSPVRSVYTNNWTVDTAHYPEFPYVPYMITADPYFLDELYFVAAMAAFSGNPNGTNYCPNAEDCAHNDWCYIPRGSTGARRMAWNLRALGNAAFFAPAGTPERAYYRQKVLNNVAIREGTFNITDGYGYTADNTKWTWGKNYTSHYQANGTNVPNPLGIANMDYSASKDETDTAVSYRVESPWMLHYLSIVLGQMSDQGFTEWDHYRTHQAYLDIVLGLNPAYNPYLIANYRWPVLRTSDYKWFQDVPTWYTGFSATARAYATWGHDAQTTDSDGGYPFIALAASSYYQDFTADGYAGSDLYAWIYAHVNYSNLNGNPKWGIVPRSQIPPPDPPQVVTTSLPNGTKGTAYSQTLQGINGTLPYTWDLSAGSLCSGLSLASGTGIISGTPDTAETCSFTSRLTDADTSTATQPLSITIVNPTTFTQTIRAKKLQRGKVIIH